MKRRKTGKRWKVAVVTDPQWGYGRDTIEGCVRYLEETDSAIDPVLLCEGFEEPDQLARQFDAFLLSGRSPWIRPYLSDQPIVHLDVPDAAPEEICISTDTEATGQMASELFRNRSVASFGYCAYPVSAGAGTAKSSEARLKGFIKGLSDKGIDVLQNPVRTHTLNNVMDLISWIDSLPRPTGILAFNDAVALEVVQACSLLRLQVPHEVAVIGIDNDQLICNLMHPSISSVNVNLAGLAYKGLATLERMLSGTPLDHPHTVVPLDPPALRESTGHFSTTADDRLVKAIQYINDHAHQKASVADVVRVSGLSHRSLELLFKEQLGRTPQEELILARHRYCMKELRVSRTSLEELSEDLGMSLSSFYRTFKKLEGCTPAEYRDYFQGGEAPIRKLSHKNPDTLQIGILSSLQWQASRDFMEGATAYAQTEPGLNLILHDRERFVSLAKQIWYDGAIIVSGDELPENVNPDTLAVYHSYEQKNAPVGNMMVDEADVGQLAARHFLRKGYRNFAYCAYFSVKYETLREKELGLIDHRGRDRYNGLRAALNEAGHQDAPIHTHLVDEATESMLQWLQDLPKPTALFCFNDQIAIQVQMMCQNHGIKVPQDIAILGVDNSPGYCRLARPSLSSIDIGFARIGAHTLKQLITCLRNEQPAANLLFPAQMVHARGSTAGLAIDDPALSKAIAYIEQNFQHAIAAKEIAKAAGLEIRPLQLRFKKYLQTTPHRYLTETRLLHAEKLLIYSTQRINEISDACSFKQTNHFCRVFREHYGITPREFRHQRGALKRA